MHGQQNVKGWKMCHVTVQCCRVSLTFRSNLQTLLLWPYIARSP